MKYAITQTSQYKRDLKRTVRRGYDLALIKAVVTQLASGQQLSAKHRDHALSGQYTGFRECHVTPDWLLVYLIDHNRLVLILTRTGSHSDLF